MKTIEIESFVSGRKEPGAGYRYFVPEFINQQWIWKDPELNLLLEKASISLGMLNSFARLVPNINLFIQLHVTKEAVISSRIEGTQTDVGEAFLPEYEISPERRHDWTEVRNYTRAMQEAIGKMEKLPISTRLLQQTHETLLTGVRGDHKLPGQYRTSQNWIGGATLKDAAFIPPAHSYVGDLMSDLEKFLHNTEIHVPTLIRIGIAHYQFETIHPFLDGNGRIGRLLITLYLVNQGVLHQPLLYLSAFFEKNKTIYYDNLTRVREKNDLLHWLKYFLIGVDETAKQSSDTLSAVIKLKEDLEARIRKEAGRRTKSALELLTHLFKDPVIVKVKQIEEICDLSPKAANDLIALFEKLGIVREFTKQTRNRIFVFEQYLDLFN